MSFTGATSSSWRRKEGPIPSASARAQGVDVDSFTEMVLSANAQFRENIAQNLCDKRCGFVGDLVSKGLGLHGVDSVKLVDSRFLPHEGQDRSDGPFTTSSGIKFNSIECF